MGNVLQTVIGSLVLFYLKISSKVKSVLGKDENNYNSFHPNDILLKDDENEAGNLKNLNIRRYVA